MAPSIAKTVMIGWLAVAGRSGVLLVAACIPVIFSLTACSRQRTVSRPPALSEYEKNERIFATNEEAVQAGIYEEFVDSLELKGQTPASPGMKQAPVTAPGPPPAPAELAEGITLGWRVQLGAFGSQQGAEALAEKVRKQVGPACPVYVRFYDPLWKVQAGDCTTRDQARSLQSFLQRSGYPDAWIVSSGINR